MVRSRLSLSLCLATIVWSLAVVQAQDICQYSCVIGLYSQFCGGARCNPSTRRGTEQGLCTATCLNAIGGTSLPDCLAAEPTFVGSTVDMQLQVLNEVESYCISLGVLEANNDTATPSDVAEEATMCSVSVEESPMLAETSVITVETPPSGEAIDSIVSEPAIESEPAIPSDPAIESSPMVEPSAPACEPDIDEASAVASESAAAVSSAAPSSSDEAPESDPLESEEAMASESSIASDEAMASESDEAMASESDEIEESDEAVESTESEEAVESMESEEAEESEEEVEYSDEAYESEEAFESEEAVESSEAAPSSEAFDFYEAAESSMEPEALPSCIIAEEIDDDDLDEDVIDFLEDL